MTCGLCFLSPQPPMPRPPPPPFLPSIHPPPPPLLPLPPMLPTPPPPSPAPEACHVTMCAGRKCSFYHNVFGHEDCANYLHGLAAAVLEGCACAGCCTHWPPSPPPRPSPPQSPLPPVPSPPPPLPPPLLATPPPASLVSVPLAHRASSIAPAPHEDPLVLAEREDLRIREAERRASMSPQASTPELSAPALHSALGVLRQRYARLYHEWREAPDHKLTTAHYSALAALLAAFACLCGAIVVCRVLCVRLRAGRCAAPPSPKFRQARRREAAFSRLGGADEEIIEPESEISASTTSHICLSEIREPAARDEPDDGYLSDGKSTIAI